MDVTYGLLFGSPPLPIFAQAAQETCTPVCALTEPRRGATVACQPEALRYRDRSGSRKRSLGEDE